MERARKRQRKKKQGKNKGIDIVTKEKATGMKRQRK